MGKRKDISNEQKIAIETLLKTGNYSHREIARRQRVSRHTVDRIAKLVQENIPSTSTGRTRCRGIRKTTQREDRIIIKKSLESRQKPLREVLHSLQEANINISERTLKSRLYEQNIHSRRPVKKPKLTEKMKKARLQWAKQHKHFTVDDWKKVVFSDESRLEAVTEQARFVRRRPSERFHENAVVKTVKHPPAAMIWSCISGEGLGPIYFVTGTMNQVQYKEVMESVLIPYIVSLGSGGVVYTFMQDGAPCHRAKSIKALFSESDLKVLPWPGNSPDLNPIENVWSALKRIVYSSRNPTLDVLKQNVENTWRNNQDLRNVAISCIQSMPKRIAAVIKAKGGLTKY